MTNLPLENGITPNWLCECAQTLYQKIIRPDLEPDVGEDPGFKKIVGYLLKLDRGSESGAVETSQEEMALTLRALYREAWFLEGDAEIPAVEMRAWKAVGYWLCYSIQCEDEAEAVAALDQILKQQQETANADRTGTGNASGPGGGRDGGSPEEEQGRPAEEEPTPGPGVRTNRRTGRRKAQAQA